MNGGVEHLLDAAHPQEIAAAVRGFRFFSLDRVAELLEDVTNGTGDPEAATRRYSELVPSDGVITQRFEATFSSSPGAFAPLESLSCAACGFLTLSEEDYGSYEICAVCDWEDDALQLANPACGGGANQLSLIEAQAMALRLAPFEVTELKGFRRSGSWRPMNSREITRATAQREREYWLNRAVGSRWECYWNGGRALPQDFPPIAG
jgi:hypothetical protein